MQETKATDFIRLVLKRNISNEARKPEEVLGEALRKINALEKLLVTPVDQQTYYIPDKRALLLEFLLSQAHQLLLLSRSSISLGDSGDAKDETEIQNVQKENKRKRNQLEKKSKKRPRYAENESIASLLDRIWKMLDILASGKAIDPTSIQRPSAFIELIASSLENSIYSPGSLALILKIFSTLLSHQASVFTEWKRAGYEVYLKIVVALHSLRETCGFSEQVLITESQEIAMINALEQLQSVMNKRKCFEYFVKSYLSSIATLLHQDSPTVNRHLHTLLSQVCFDSSIFDGYADVLKPNEDTVATDKMRGFQKILFETIKALAEDHEDIMLLLPALFRLFVVEMRKSENSNTKYHEVHRNRSIEFAFFTTACDIVVGNGRTTGMSVTRANVMVNLFEELSERQIVYRSMDDVYLVKLKKLSEIIHQVDSIKENTSVVAVDCISRMMAILLDIDKSVISSEYARLWRAVLFNHRQPAIHLCKKALSVYGDLGKLHDYFQEMIDLIVLKQEDVIGELNLEMLILNLFGAGTNVSDIVAPLSPRVLEKYSQMVSGLFPAQSSKLFSHLVTIFLDSSGNTAANQFKAILSLVYLVWHLRCVQQDETLRQECPNFQRELIGLHERAMTWIQSSTSKIERMLGYFVLSRLTTKFLSKSESKIIRRSLNGVEDANEKALVVHTMASYLMFSVNNRNRIPTKSMDSLISALNMSPDLSSSLIASYFPLLLDSIDKKQFKLMMSLYLKKRENRGITETFQPFFNYTSIELMIAKGFISKFVNSIFDVDCGETLIADLAQLIVSVVNVIPLHCLEKKTLAKVYDFLMRASLNDVLSKDLKLYSSCRSALSIVLPVVRHYVSFNIKQFVEFDRLLDLTEDGNYVNSTAKLIRSCPMKEEILRSVASDCDITKCVDLFYLNELAIRDAPSISSIVGKQVLNHLSETSDEDQRTKHLQLSLLSKITNSIDRGLLKDYICNLLKSPINPKHALAIMEICLSLKDSSLIKEVEEKVFSLLDSRNQNNVDDWLPLYLKFVDMLNRDEFRSWLKSKLSHKYPTATKLLHLTLLSLSDLPKPKQSIVFELGIALISAIDTNFSDNPVAALDCLTIIISKKNFCVTVVELTYILGFLADRVHVFSDYEVVLRGILSWMDLLLKTRASTSIAGVSPTLFRLLNNIGKSLLKDQHSEQTWNSYLRIIRSLCAANIRDRLRKYFLFLITQFSSTKLWYSNKCSSVAREQMMHILKQLLEVMGEKELAHLSAALDQSAKKVLSYVRRTMKLEK